MASHPRDSLGYVYYFQFRDRLGSPWNFCIPRQISRVKHGLDFYLRILLIISCYLHNGMEIYS